MNPSRIVPNIAGPRTGFRTPSLRLSRRRGGVLIHVLAFLLITTILLSGMGQFVVSHQTLVTSRANHASALDLAEAGINYELRKITVSPTQADPQSTPYAGTLGNGSFSVYVTGTSGGAWSAGGALDIVSTGTVNGISRTITIQGGATGSGSTTGTGVFTVGSGAISGSETITGDLGTNGALAVSGYGDVTGHVYIDGPGASWTMSGSGTYNMVYNSTAANIQTVDQIANAAFPASTYPPGGLAYLATHNSNAAAGLGTTLTTSGCSSITLPPGNYYFTSINASGNNPITFNNTSGSVNIWVGPSGGSGAVNISGSTTAVALSTNPNVHIYVATKGGMNLSGYDDFQAGFYAYDTDSSGNPFGSINISGSTTITGQIVGYNVAISGYMDLTSVPGLFSSGSGTYAFTRPWTEPHLSD
jgi:Tfp pilus assembly protein PilX